MNLDINRYDRVVWPDEFADKPDAFLVLGERILLALQNLDITGDRIADALERKSLPENAE
jgi:hypothetical protein